MFFPFVGLSWGTCDVNKHLFNPDRAPVTDQKNRSTKVYLEKKKKTNEFIGMTCRNMGEELLTGTWTIQRHLHYSKTRPSTW